MLGNIKQTFLWERISRSQGDFDHVYRSESNWNLECWFLWREENRRTRGENPTEQAQPTTNSTHMSCHARESNPGHSGGRRALSLLRHPSIPKW